MYAKKLILSTLVHFLWLFMLLLNSYAMIISNSWICDFIIEPYMVMIVYPTIVNIIVYRIRTKNPLPDKEQDRKLKKINLVYTVLILLWSLPYAVACLISFLEI